ncbi:hypothetical protein [Polymorphum gilvum]|uniref:Mu-like prophage FluMu N-terminal domain-containing protein n=1 Tax=Polymorphum gilvum (strain LMG 25793 / CGMCC 1.9160 / SL003B-26A1) TaxID=991905 RepID=F2J643_POLGS|nr:hypothetical protein [Polymorphum gilvum]ADZ72407.1 hypothetical protein SL003B_3987 [Polymorphum gilvum SL003B-26A1]
MTRSRTRRAATAPEESKPAAPGAGAGIETPPTIAPAAAGFLVVTSPRPRRRAGRAFGRDPLRIPLAGLGEDERRAIEADPLLFVRVEEA